MKIGMEVRIDVSKIDKARLYKGEKGTYLTMTAFVDPINADQYGNNGMVTHKKEQNEQQAPILGNTKVFWSEELPVAQQGGFQQQTPQQQGQQQSVGGNTPMDDEIPFAPIAKQYKNLINCI